MGSFNLVYIPKYKTLGILLESNVEFCLPIIDIPELLEEMDYKHSLTLNWTQVRKYSRYSVSKNQLDYIETNIYVSGFPTLPKNVFGFAMLERHCKDANNFWRQWMREYGQQIAEQYGAYTYG